MVETKAQKQKSKDDTELIKSIEAMINAKLAAREDADEKFDKLVDLNKKLIEENKSLRERVVALETKIDSQYTVADLVAECITAATDPIATSEQQENVSDPEPDPRQHLSTLLLSDSMMKHVDMPNTMKEVIPGAGCDELFWRFLELNEKYTFSDIFICVGTNYLSDRFWTNDEIAHEIKNFLVALNAITPSTTRLTYLQILPKRGRYIKNIYLPRINYINRFIDDWFLDSEVDFVNFHDLGNIFNSLNVFNIICWDGTHLNYYGAKMVGEYIIKQLQYDCMYSDDRL